MKFSYKQKLFLYFFVIFSLFTIGIYVFAQSQERKFRTEALEEKLDAYTEITHLAIRKGQRLDSVLTFFPMNMRLSLIDDQGVVQFDNAIDELELLDNHLERVEIVAAKLKGSGANIRTSSSNSVEYIYYSKYFNDYYIRVALPYDVKVQQFIKSDNLFLYYIIALFIGMIVLINLVASRFGSTIKQLRDFVVSSDDKEDVVLTQFPDDEFGEISEKIVDNYKQLKASKRKVSQEREKLLQHIQSSKEGVCFFSENYEVQFYNGLFIQYLNLLVENSNKKPTVVFSDPLFSSLNQFLNSLEKNDFFETQIEKHGKTFSLRANVFEDKSFEIILNDITKEKKTQVLKQEMTGNIAHELRTPVTSIRGYLETVLNNDLEEEKERQFLGKAYNQSLFLSELIQDMGLITKMEEAPDSFSFEPYPLVKVLEDIKSDLAMSLEQKDIHLKWDISDQIKIKSNRNLLYSIFRNLTDNVIRYAGENIEVFVSQYDEDDKYYYILYADNGKGIENEKHFTRLFERFYRINEGRSRDTGGSGLGLSIVRNALALHKGTITVKNRQGGGLEFLMKLPKG